MVLRNAGDYERRRSIGDRQGYAGQSSFEYVANSLRCACGNPDRIDLRESITERIGAFIHCLRNLGSLLSQIRAREEDLRCVERRLCRPISFATHASYEYIQV